jgi:hypothetical protein
MEDPPLVAHVIENAVRHSILFDALASGFGRLRRRSGLRGTLHFQ